MAGTPEVSTGRSPRYPRISLPEALKHAQSIYEAAHRSVLSSDTAYRVMGFSGKSGTSATALGAVRQFDLVEGLRGDLRISKLALQILEPATPGERVDAIFEAANSPEAFRQIFDHFGENVPKSNEVIRSFLIRSLDFSKSGADDCIASFRETFDYAEREEQLSHSSESVSEFAASTVEPSDDQLAKTAISSDEVQILPTQNRSQFARIPLTRTCIAELRVEGEITRMALSRLIQHIELMMEIWAEEDKNFP